MHEFQAYQEIQAELNDVIQKSYHPEFFVDYWFDGELYFNPVFDCGLFIVYDKKYKCFSHTWFPDGTTILFFVRNVSRNVLHKSPDQIYRKIKDLYIFSRLKTLIH